MLTVEHRAAKAPEPITVALAGDDQTAHLAVVDEAAVDHSTGPELADAVVVALADGPLSRTALRAAVRVRNERLGIVLTKLVAAGRVVHDGDRWARVLGPVPVPPLAQERERNGTAKPA